MVLLHPHLLLPSILFTLSLPNVPTKPNNNSYHSQPAVHNVTVIVHYHIYIYEKQVNRIFGIQSSHAYSTKVDISEPLIVSSTLVMRTRNLRIERGWTFYMFSGWYIRSVRKKQRKKKDIRRRKLKNEGGVFCRALFQLSPLLCVLVDRRAQAIILLLIKFSRTKLKKIDHMRIRKMI